jgi:hypothetical protein
MYASSGQVWSEHPNSVLVAEAAHLKPGRALDVGRGEGADAVPRSAAHPEQQR